MRLNELSPAPGARRKARRVGRGIGSGKGKTCGRGHKGAKARAGTAIKGFEGGQMPIYRRLPKRGFHLNMPKRFAEVRLARIVELIEQKRLSGKGVIDEEALVQAGAVRRRKQGIRVIGPAEKAPKITLKVAHATASVVAAIEKAGGKVELTGAASRKGAQAEKAE